MLAVKAAVGIVPKPLRNLIKRNAYLTSLYSHSLQKSGLFYGFDSHKKLLALYATTVRRQQVALQSTPFENRESLRIVIVAEKITDAQSCLATLKTQINSVERFFVVLKGSTISELNDVPIIQSFSDLEFEDSCGFLLINATDRLVANGFAKFIDAINDCDIMYSDTDFSNKNGQRELPQLLPDWNPDLQLSTAYINTGVVFSAEALKVVQLSKKVSSADSIAALVCLLWLEKRDINVSHIPVTLVTQVQPKQTAKKNIESVRETVNALLSNELSITTNEVNSLFWSIKNSPLVSLIIPTKNSKELVKACIESILNKTNYKNYEILLVDNNSDDEESIAYFNELSEYPKITVLKYPHPFNYSAINNYAVKHAKGEVIGLINNDIEVITPEWLTYMVGHVLRSDIGCVGAKLLYGDDRVQHAGVVMGYGGGAGHAHKYFPRFHPGYMKRLVASHNYSAVTAACLLVKKAHYEEVGGLNETHLTVAFNDVDFCLKVRNLGVRNLYCAEAELYHHESVSRGLDVSKEKMARFNQELHYLKSTWADVIARDPAYNPNLTLRRENFSIKDEKEWLEEQNSGVNQ